MFSFAGRRLLAPANTPEVLRAAGHFVQAPRPLRTLFTSACLRQVESDAEGGAGGAADEGPSNHQRKGRLFLDASASRTQEGIRADPNNKNWGGLIDILEHSAYCDGQREEDEDGFFFDLTTPEYDSDCDGDPFSAGYLTEDEYEFPDSYTPSPFLPRRIVDQIYFLYQVRNIPISSLCSKYKMSSERICAIIKIKRSEPEMIATKRYQTVLDDLVQEIYRGGVRDSAEKQDFKPDFDMGVNFHVMRDDQMPDDCYPVIRTQGNIMRQALTLPKLPPPERAARKHASKFVFKDVSGRSDNLRHDRPLTVSDYDGSIRPATNQEALYRSWATRNFKLERVKTKSGLPFTEDEAHKPASYRVPP